MNLLRSLSVFVLVLFMCEGVGYGITIKHCDQTAISETAKAYEMISNNIDNIFNLYETKIPEMQPNKQRKVRNKLLTYKEEFKRKWPNLKIICRDNKKTCIKDKFLGQAKWSGTGDRGKEVNLCYYDHVRSNQKLCGLVNTIVHELGHEIKIPTGSKHNKAPNRNTDPVYIFGNAAEEICKVTGNPILAGSTDRGIGAACYFNDQCVSKKCGKDEDGENICIFK